MSAFSIIYSTFPAHEDALAVAESLVEKRLAACVNVLPGLTSLYEWKGEFLRESEVAVLIKTRTSLSEQVQEEVKRLHPYETPALLVLPAESGNPEYLAWLQAQTSPMS